MSVESTRRAIWELWADRLEEEPGVLQVSAVARSRDGGLEVIRIGDGSPVSGSDFFALSVARARVDAIVTTGSILRAEPRVTHDPGPELRAWRHEVLGKQRAPTLVVLTRGVGLPLGHPALQRRGDVLIATSPRGAARLGGRVAVEGTRILSLDDATLRGLLAALADRGLPSVCVEAGPSSSASLYESPCAVDELLLSVFEDGPLSADRIAGRFPSEPELRAALGPPRSEVRRTEPSGPWIFRRYRRSATPRE